jgi:hypothetical protein
MEVALTARKRNFDRLSVARSRARDAVSASKVSPILSCRGSAADGKTRGTYGIKPHRSARLALCETCSSGLADVSTPAPLAP